MDALPRLQMVRTMELRMVGFMLRLDMGGAFLWYVSEVWVERICLDLTNAWLHSLLAFRKMRGMFAQYTRETWS